MENSNQFTLMEGKFNIQDATSIVLNFYNTKIVYHNQQLLRMGEQGNINVGEIEQKITVLNQTKQEIIGFLANAKKEGKMVGIEGVIGMEIV